MFAQLLITLVQTLSDLLTGLFLLRFFMQWMRVPFRNPLGQFVIAATDWAVLPARRLIPGVLGLDVASVLMAWLMQMSLLGVVALLSDHWSTLLLVQGLIETVRVLIYMVIGLVLLQAVMSWISPHAPLAPVVNALTQPLLAPLQRFIPPLGGVDLSPLALLLILQVLQTVLSQLRFSLLL